VSEEYLHLCEEVHGDEAFGFDGKENLFLD